MYALLPKWGGSQSQMQQFADSSQYYEAQNPALQFLKAWVPLDQGDEFFEHSQLPQALDQYTQAVQAGGEYWTSYRRRARAYYAMHEWQKAVDDAAHSNALYPDNSENLRVLAFAAYRLNNPEASILYLGDLLRFEMPDPETAQLLSSDQALLKSQGKENW
jgi:tetratricopeptide (TPR) repeat protein